MAKAQPIMAYFPKEGSLDKDEFLQAAVTMSKTCVIRKKKNGKNVTEYIELPCAFDIETYSFYKNGIEDLEHKRAIMYHWQFGIGNEVVFGRTWESFLDLLYKVKIIFGLDEHRRMICYVHFLSYEFQFFRKWVQWTKVFIEKRYKLYYAITDDYGFEFRDSLKLWGGKGLEKVGEGLKRYPVQKMTGDLDHSKARHALTPLTKKEQKYCENDVRVILHGIQEEIEDCGGIHKVPLTNTQRVRMYVRDKCLGGKKFKRYHDFISSLTITPAEYNQLKRAFQGGFTHCNKYMFNQTLSNVQSYDIGSSYPAVMLLEKYPMGKGTFIQNPTFSEKQFNNLLKTKCLVFDMDIVGLEPNTEFEHIISESKCHPRSLKGSLVWNGRIVRADQLTVTVTNVDYELIMKYYKLAPQGSVRIYNLWIYEKGYLPKEIAESVLDFYEQSTKLKGVAGKEIEYMVSKNMRNATYGMMVTDIVKEEWFYTPDENDVYEKISSQPDFDKVQYQKEAIEKYNTNPRRFNWYPWGVFITAYARRNLLEAIFKVGKDYCYSDTDSIKFVNPEQNQHIFDEYNKGIDDKIILSASHFGIPIEKYRPIVHGKERPIGYFEYDGMYKRFKTLGAKRYLVELEDGSLHLTVSGANKKTACNYIARQKNPFEFFNNQMMIPTHSSGRTVHSYINDEHSGIIVDYNGVPYQYYEKSAIHIENTSFTVNADRLLEFISSLKGGNVIYAEENLAF